MSYYRFLLISSVALCAGVPAFAEPESDSNIYTAVAKLKPASAPQEDAFGHKSEKDFQRKKVNDSFKEDLATKKANDVQHKIPNNVSQNEELFQPTNALSLAVKALCEHARESSQEKTDDELLAVILRLNENTSDGSFQDDEVVYAINFMVARGVSVSDITACFNGLNIPIPARAKMDWGLNELFGGSSLLGSASSHLKSIYHNGLPSWVLKNGMVALGYYSSAKIIFSLLTPVAAAEITNAPKNECPMPKGTWGETCTPSTAEVYMSTDPNVPQTCTLETQCSTMYEGLPKTQNTVFYDKNRVPTYVNNNGTLSVVGQDGKMISTQTQNYECSAFQGSFKKTCDVSAMPYSSTDSNLAGQPFCVMTSKCKDLSEKTQSASQVYYKSTLADGTTKVENCNGELVVHTDPRNDGMCYGKTLDQIKGILSKFKDNLASHYFKGKTEL